MINYPGEYFQLPLGVFSATLGSIFSYLGEYFQLSQLLRAPLWARLGPDTEIDDFRAGPRPDFDDSPSQNQRFGTRHRIYRIYRIYRNQRSEVQPEPAFYTRRGSG